MEPVAIGSRKQLFIDDRLIASLDGATLELSQPVKHLGNPIITGDKPWERNDAYLFEGSVFWDPAYNRYRMWYTSNEGRVYPPVHDHIDYAESVDGLHWEKPALGVVEYQGARANNIAFTGKEKAENVNVIRDEHETDPAKRYKLLYWDRPIADQPSGICVAYAPDGIHWTPYEGNPVVVGVADTFSVLGWDERHGRYLGYFRPNQSTGQGLNLPRAGKEYKRVIGLSTSEDFLHWSPIQPVLQPDEHDPPDLQFYCMAPFRYEDFYLGYVTCLHTFDCRQDTQLAYSRDGIHWQRAGHRQTFIPTGHFGSFDGRQVYAAAPIIRDDEIWTYYGGFNVGHSLVSMRGGEGLLFETAIGLARLRLDGFVGVHAGPNPATLTTHPLTFTGARLTVNVQPSAKAGAYDDSTLAQVEILDAGGQPLPGYTAADAQPLTAFATAETVSWQGGPDVGALAGQPVRLRFRLANVKLFAFQFLP